jgi:hypothetical protein
MGQKDAAFVGERFAKLVEEKQGQERMRVQGVRPGVHSSCTNTLKLVDGWV